MQSWPWNWVMRTYFELIYYLVCFNWKYFRKVDINHNTTPYFIQNLYPSITFAFTSCNSRNSTFISCFSNRFQVGNILVTSSSRIQYLQLFKRLSSWLFHVNKGEFHYSKKNHCFFFFFRVKEEDANIILNNSNLAVY